MKRLPDQLWPKAPVAIYRMERSHAGIVPASSLEGTGEIALYDTAFGQLPGIYVGQVIAHELAHQLYFEMGNIEKRKYALAAGWDRNTHNWKHGTKFMRETASESLNENFAVNVENLLFETGIERRTIPKTYDWLAGKFGRNFKLDGSCHEK